MFKDAVLGITLIVVTEVQVQDTGDCVIICYVPRRVKMNAQKFETMLFPQSTQDMENLQQKREIVGRHH